MKRESIIRAFAGTMVLLSVILSLLFSVNWLWLAGFVGVNLLQSSLTGFCPLDWLLKKKGFE